MKVGRNKLHSRDGNVLGQESPWPVCRLSRHGLSSFTKKPSIEPGLLVLVKAKQVMNCQPSPEPKGLTHEKCTPSGFTVFPTGSQSPHASAGLDGKATNNIKIIGRQVVAHKRVKGHSPARVVFQATVYVIEAVRKTLLLDNNISMSTNEATPWSKCDELKRMAVSKRECNSELHSICGECKDNQQLSNLLDEVYLIFN